MIVTFKVLVRAAASGKIKIIDQWLHKKLSTSLTFSRACLTLQTVGRLCKSVQHVMTTQHVRRAWGWIKTRLRAFIWVWHRAVASARLGSNRRLNLRIVSALLSFFFFFGSTWLSSIIRNHAVVLGLTEFWKLQSESILLLWQIGDKKWSTAFRCEHAR